MSVIAPGVCPLIATDRGPRADLDADLPSVETNCGRTIAEWHEIIRECDSGQPGSRGPNADWLSFDERTVEL